MLQIPRDVYKARKILKQRVCFRVENGNANNIWLNPWIFYLPSFISLPKQGSNHTIKLINWVLE